VDAEVTGEREAMMTSTLFVLRRCVHPSLSLPLPGVDAEVTGERETAMGSVLFVLLPFSLRQLKGTGDKLHGVTGGLPLGTNDVGAQSRATVRNAHTIAVIDEGKVVEQGYRSYIKMLQLQRLTSMLTWSQRLILEELPTQTNCSDSSSSS
jgi:predicted secreted protein